MTHCWHVADCMWCNRIGKSLLQVPNLMSHPCGINFRLFNILITDMSDDSDIEMVPPQMPLSQGSVNLSDTETDTSAASTSIVLTSSRKRSPVWAYFTPSATDRNWVTCDLCTDSKRAKVKTKDSATTNLFSHLRYHHPAKHAEIAPLPVARSTPTSRAAKKRASNQPTILEAVDRTIPYPKDSDKYKQLLKVVTRYLVSGMFG